MQFTLDKSKGSNHKIEIKFIIFNVVRSEINVQKRSDIPKLY